MFRVRGAGCMSCFKRNVRLPASLDRTLEKITAAPEQPGPLSQSLKSRCPSEATPVDDYLRRCRRLGLVDPRQRRCPEYWLGFASIPGQEFLQRSWTWWLHETVDRSELQLAKMVSGSSSVIRRSVQCGPLMNLHDTSFAPLRTVIAAQPC